MSPWTDRKEIDVSTLKNKDQAVKESGQKLPLHRSYIDPGLVEETTR